MLGVFSWAKKRKEKETAIGGGLFTVASLAVDRPELISRPVIPQAAPLSHVARRKTMLATQSQSISRATWAAGHDLRHSIPDLFVHPVNNSQPPALSQLIGHVKIQRAHTHTDFMYCSFARSICYAANNTSTALAKLTYIAVCAQELSPFVGLV